jgi:hypothetical protein
MPLKGLSLTKNSSLSQDRETGFSGMKERIKSGLGGSA